MNRLLIALLAILTGLGAPASAGAAAHNAAEVELVQAAQTINDASEQHIGAIGLYADRHNPKMLGKAWFLDIAIVSVPRVYFGVDRAFE